MHTCISFAFVPSIALVQECPLSSSATSCASSITAISYSFSISSISTVEAVILLPEVSMHSCPVSIVHKIPASVILSYTSSASRRSGPRYTPLSAVLRRSRALYVLPLFVGPIWSMNFLFIFLASGNSSSGRAGTKSMISCLSRLFLYSAYISFKLVVHICHFCSLPSFFKKSGVIARISSSSNNDISILTRFGIISVAKTFLAFLLFV